MATTPTSRFVTLLQRELREYRNSLFWTPVIVALVLGVLMLVSVVLANRISVIGDTILQGLLSEGGSRVNISLSINEESGNGVTVVATSEQDLPVPAPPASDSDYRVFLEETPVAEEWNFSREWTFNPDMGRRAAPDDAADDHRSGRELNSMLGVVHGILLLILLITSANYLLSALYDDRKDQSILFFRSMPIAEWQVVLAKFVTAIAIAPLIYIAISLLLQLVYVLFMMLLVWRSDQDPFAVVVGNIDFVALMLNPISGWVMAALMIAPTYAWLLCASALAKRSPFLMAITPIAALFIAEAVFLGSRFVGDALERHVVHISDDSAVFGPDWAALDLSSVAAGLLFAAAALAAAVWLREHRWELK